MRIRQFNKVVGFLGLLALIVGPACFSLSFTDYLLLILGVSIFEILAMQLYRKHRFRKNRPASTN